MNDEARAVALRNDVLRRLKVGYQTPIGPDVLDSFGVEVASDQLADQLILALKAYVLAEHLDGHTVQTARAVIHDEPSSPWQHAKRDWRLFAGTRVGRWFVRRRPVRTVPRTTTVTLTARWDRYLAFPESRLLPDDKLGTSYRWLHGAIVDVDETTRSNGDLR